MKWLYQSRFLNNVECQILSELVHTEVRKHTIWRKTIQTFRKMPKVLIYNDLRIINIFIHSYLSSAYFQIGHFFWRYWYLTQNKSTLGTFTNNKLGRRSVGLLHRYSVKQSVLRRTAEKWPPMLSVLKLAWQVEEKESYIGVSSRSADLSI